ncbi:selenocysteine-specific translation elongation factor [Brevibacterium casei]|uniref:selenocysteine-specific translation elongation factor n=1 Tax=Brevibacterium casei TaxID=33889 RepID=UPI000927A9A7|nr:selenocysteine-specific translation elongation factor [Brevibacterium casei]MCT2183276.1 selenocysteine-specific translation elongation factor [Brevibacterium casei]MDH5149398.1 selenocysteine-specific translation elongation factor [Brevibacterium casei]SIH76594.1 selenocysteine-specific elongation factor SelB [Mycobacteroides abscessus subsp. abscessus]
MFVVATAGHVDHGKSTLVKALTGMEPDRWAEERRRGLTIDLGFAWTTLPSGRELAFVDVPGHERFLANMLAGVGPAPIVCFVIAADKGWQAQSSDHRDAIAALGIDRGLVVVTRADLAPDTVTETEAQVRAELRGTTLADAPIVTVSATTGQGMDELIARLDEVTAAAPAPDADARVRLWIDRAFSITGAGTVVTGTLTAGILRAGDRVRVVGESVDVVTGIRGMQSRESSAEVVTPAARVAVNVRDVPVDDIHRGDALITPDAWPIVEVLDVRRTMGEALDDGVHELMLHIGTAAVPVRLRPFDAEHARLTLERPLPLQLGDRMVLRNPGSRNVFAGVVVLDVDPPELGRRGDGARRAAALASRPVTGDVLAEVARRGAVERAVLVRFGLTVPEALPSGVEALGGWLVHAPALQAWVTAAKEVVAKQLAAQPMAPGVPVKAVVEALRRVDPPLPSAGAQPTASPGSGTGIGALVAEVIRRAGLEAADGVVRPPGHRADLGPAEAGVAEVERRLKANPFDAPEADDLRALRLGARELAVAEKAGRVLRLGDGVVVSPRTPAQAMRLLAGLDQPFTTSQARQALGTTRRVVIPLLEHLDSRGWTRRLDGSHREVVR